MKADWLQWPAVAKLAAAFAAQDAPLRFVGGAVRDTLLGRAVRDIDAATPLLPDDVMALLQKAGIRAIPTGIAHGTVTALIDGRPIEITTLRKDTACDGRHAVVTYTDDWREDAARRDFTMNALYLSPEGELFDVVGGVADAKAGHVRFIGEAAARIEEDYLRILRFFRFYAWYGSGSPDAEALAACAHLAAGMSRLSGERVREEMLKLLAADAAAQTVTIMQAHAILAHVLGFAVRDVAMLERFAAIERQEGLVIEPLVKISAFLFNADVSPPEALTLLATRWRLPKVMEKTLALLVSQHGELTPGTDEAGCKRLLRRLGALDFKRCVLVSWAAGEQDAAPYRAMPALADHWQAPVFPVTGDDLVARGLMPGKMLGERLEQLEEVWEAGGYVLTKEQLLASISSLRGA